MRNGRVPALPLWVCHALPKDGVVEIIDSCSVPVRVSCRYQHTRGKHELSVASTVPLRPRSVYVRRTETVKVSPVTQISKTKTERIEHSNLTLLPRHRIRSQCRLGNVVRCYREALSGLDGVEGCNHQELIGTVSLHRSDSRFYIDSLARIVELQLSAHQHSYQSRLLAPLVPRPVWPIGTVRAAPPTQTEPFFPSHIFECPI